MSHSSDEMQAYYAARASYYDAVYLKPERARDLMFLQSHIPGRLAGRTVLEVACGTGFWTQYIAPHATHLTAIDLTPEPLEFARLRTNTANVTFVEADAYALPSSLGQFQAAFAGLWFSHVPISKRRLFFDSLHARLLPGSRVVLLDNSAVQCVELPIAERDAEGNTYQQRTLRDGSSHRVLKNFPTASELNELAASFATRVDYRELDNFWLLEYELRAAR